MITAKVIAHSRPYRYKHKDIQDLATLEIEYPRIVLAELNTHNSLAKNSSSSRAIPFNAMAAQLTGRPVRFGAANPGMQDKGTAHDALITPPDWMKEKVGTDQVTAEEFWWHCRDFALDMSRAYYNAGYHKQVYNRLTEPFQMMKTVITGQNWANFLWLRDHEDADPTIAELARCIKVSLENSEPELLLSGEWHLPYVDSEELEAVGIQNAKVLSVARCAAVSYRKTDYDLDKSKEVFDRLLNGGRIHASPFGHQCTPHTYSTRAWDAADDGMFYGWRQYRKDIPGECKEGFLVNE